mgnify:CR=1 FL=1
MENKIDNSVNYINKFKKIYNKRKKTFLLILVLAIIALIGLNIVNIYKINSNKKIAEKYIQAGLLLASKDNVKAKTLYREIIYSKNKFYSQLSLNTMIENNLEKNEDEVLKLFEAVQQINLKREEKNLIKLKKALFLIKISKDIKGKQLLKEIVEDNSTWSSIALEIQNL